MARAVRPPIADVAGLERALWDATLAYDGAVGWSAWRAEQAAFADRLDEALDLWERAAGYIAIDAPDDASPADFDAAVARVEQRVQVVRELRDLARRGSQGIQARRRRGRPGDRDLHQFVADLAAYWRNDLGRDFTQLFHSDGEPLSPAAVFVVAAAKHCGVRATNQKLKTAMIAVIGTFGKSAD